MTPRSLVPSLLLAAAALAPLAGCSNDANTPEAKIAEQAVGVQPASGTSKSEQKTRDVVVEKETRVVDKQTGQVLSDQKQSTPVKIVEQTEVKKDVKVNVGDTTGTGKK